MLTISVRKLDGDVINITTNKKEKGEFVFDKVCESIDLVEKDYFGLQYEDKTGVTNWLDLSRRLGRLIKSDNAEFQFAVKFYPPDPSQLQEDVTRYQLCLQIRNDILSEKLLCSFVTYALLGSYLVQSELGDYSPEEYPDSSYLKSFRFSPEQTPELESKVMELHRTHKGQTPAEAELHYLENAKKLAMYGVDFHPAKDSEGVDITLGVCSTGLLVYRERLRINRFAWPKILKISYKRNYFYVKIRPGDYEPYENTVVFKLESHKAAKRLWNVCVEHHTFFRLMTPEDVARPGLIPGLSNKFPSLRKTHYQTKRNTIEREPPSSFRKSQRYITSKSMDPLQPSNKEKDAKKRHTMPPENTQSPRKDKDDASVSASSQEGDFSINERIPGAVPVLPMAEIKKKDQKENGVANESDEEKENRNLKENREEDKKKKSSGLGLFKRSEGKRDKLEEIGAKREYEYEYEEDTKKSPKGVSKGFSYERSSSKEGSQPSSPEKDPTKSPTKARTFAFNYAPETTPESDKKSGFSSLFSKRKKKDETSETSPKTDEKRDSPLAAFLPGKDKKSKVSLFKDKSKDSPSKDSPSKDTSFKDNESPAKDAKNKDKDSKSKDKSKSKDSKESPSKDSKEDSPTKDKKDSLVRGLFKDSSKDKDSLKKDSSKEKDASKKDSAKDKDSLKKDLSKDKDSATGKDTSKKESSNDKDSSNKDLLKNRDSTSEMDVSKDSLKIKDKDSKDKSKDKDSKEKSKDKDSKEKSKDKDSKDKSKDKDSKDKSKDKDSKEKSKDKDSKDKAKDKDSKDKSKDKDSKDKSKDKDSKDKSKEKDSKIKLKDGDLKEVSSDLDVSKESTGKDSSSKDKDSLTKDKEEAKKDKSAAKSGFFGFKDKKKDSEAFIGEERSPKGGLFGWRKTPTKKDEENDENKPKVVKTTTKQSVVKEGSNVTRNIEEKIEDLATGDVTLNTAESLLEDQGSSPYVTATAVTTRTAMTTEDIGKNEKTSQVEEKTVARTTTTSGTRQEQRVVTQEVRATTVVSEPQERRSSISSTSSDDSGTPIDGDVAPYYAVAPHQEPIVETEAVFLTPGTGVAPQTTATPFVSTSTNLIGPVASETVVSGEIVSSQTITSKTRTVETVTYKTEKDGVVETRVEQKITIQSDGDPIDHDKALQEAIQEATAMNPDMQVEKIEIQQEALDQ